MNAYQAAKLILLSGSFLAMLCSVVVFFVLGLLWLLVYLESRREAIKARQSRPRS